MRFVVQPSGKRLPLDLEPRADGNVRVSADQNVAEVLGPLERMAAGEPLFVSHFATCPVADTFRGGSRGRR
jgi:hypothetical protein